ncbi:YbjN domain-containing protein [Paraburkholderia sp. ZP32-5]|uniref:YbjN domain-containing protein n=1 Tax=Paraburkholderia sp. ZP32-5 TaxID=2883245 RepID=UPI001F2D7D30|nr:YbjN domain-containing protein [Paraburkholderia sp. ZP32-5]
MTTAAKKNEAKNETNAATAPVNESAPASVIVEAVSPTQLGDVFRAAGYRVTPTEQNGRVQLMSASQGVGFAVRFGNPGVEAGTHIDYTLSCTIQVQGDLPADLVPSWNRSKRFARLAVHQQFLVLEMDVMVAGGVSTRHLRSTIELWDRLMQEFLLHLRSRPTMAQAEAASAATPSAQQDAGAAGDSDAEASQQ